MVVQQKIRLLLKLSFFSIIISFVFMLQQAMRPKLIKLHFCSSFSESVCEKIRNNVDLEVVKSANDVKAKLQKIILSIYNISILNSATRYAHIFVHCAKPILKLYDVANKKFYIFAENQSIIDTQEYVSSFIENLPLIYMHEHKKSEENLSDLYNFSKNLTTEIYDKYCVHWYCNTEIHLKDLNNELIIITDINSIKIKEKIEMAIKLFSIKKNEKKIIKIDIRFKSMIIYRGQNNEKS